MVEIRHDRGTDARSVASLLTALDEHRVVGAPQKSRAIPTGMDPLDQVLDGGLRLHDLILVGGVPGIGKTIATLQWARHVALSGGTALYVCYEHDHVDLMVRLMSLELGMSSDGEPPSEIEKLRVSLTQAIDGLTDIRTVLDMQPLARVVYERVRGYSDRLTLARASGRYSTVDALEDLATSFDETPNVMFIDYLQKIPVVPDPANESEKVTRAAEALKELALSHNAAIVSVVAADTAGLHSSRLRLHHLRGSSALAYESDLVVLLNDKQRIVAKAHLAYDPVRAAQYQHSVIFSVEKNRHGAAHIDMEFRKDFGHYRFDPRGGFPSERLVDERISEE